MKQNSEYHLTIIEGAGLIGRLKDELREVAHQSELTWPEFKRDPTGFTGRMVRGYAAVGSRFLKGPNVVLAMTTAVLILVAVIVSILLLDKLQLIHRRHVAVNRSISGELELTDWVREQRKFAGIESLKAQLAHDIAISEERGEFDPSRAFATV